MEKSFDFIVDLLAGIIIIFLFPLVYFGLKQDSIIQTIVSIKTESLSNELRGNGYINKDRMDLYLSDLSKTGLIYDVSITQRHKIREPEYRLRTSDEVINDQNSAYTGSNNYTYTNVTTAIPTVNDPVNPGNVNTETNESVLATAVNTPASPSHVHTDACFSGHRHAESGCTGFDAYTGILRSVNAVTNTSDYDMLDCRYINISLVCAYCGSYIATAYHRDYKNDNIDYAWNSDEAISFSQIYLKPDNSLGYYSLNQNMYLLSPTGGDGWTYTAGMYKKLNPDYTAMLNAFNTAYWGADVNSWQQLGFIPEFSCPFCLQNGQISKTLKKVYFCGITEDTVPKCSQTVTSINATHPVQTVYIGAPILSTVTATYLDGSTKAIIGTASGYDSSKIGAQTVTLTYSGLIDHAKKTGTKTCSITVTVVPKTKICPNGHTYNLNSNGSDPGCPYCRAWLRSLVITYPITGSISIFKGTSLSDNGVTLFAAYMDGHTQIVYEGYSDNLDKNYVGTQNVTISYKGFYVQLTVVTKRNLRLCPVCNRYYELYPDGSDPGCPYCASLTPVFTGNIMSYYRDFYKEDILKELYEGSGIYYFKREDYITIQVVNHKKSWGRRLLGFFIKSLKDNGIQVMKGGYIRESGN